MEENIITLTNENNENEDFYLIATFGVNDDDYVALMPVEDEEELILILKTGEDDLGNALFRTVDNEEELNEVIEVFEELMEENE